MAQDKIMVVDNEMEIIQLIKLYLSREGYEVVWTTESTKAAELAQKEKPDLILLDVVMPGLSGSNSAAGSGSKAMFRSSSSAAVIRTWTKSWGFPSGAMTISQNRSALQNW